MSDATIPAAKDAAKEPSRYGKYAILYVDDEEQALKYFGKGLGKEFTVLTANSVAVALEILARDHDKIGVVLTDQRMPKQCGTELLKEITARWPHMVRIMVTAFSELESAVEAVNAGQIYKYLTKPVDFPQLRETLKGAMDLFLSRGEKDSLLQVKMSSLRRMVVADRVRSLANLTYGMTQHLRNSVTAMGAFLEEVDPSNTENQAAAMAAGGNKVAAEMWKLAADERDRLIGMLAEIQKSMVDPICQFTNESDATQLVTQAIAAAEKEIAPKTILADVAPALGSLKVDGEKLTHLVKTLVSYVSRHNKPDGKVTVALKAAPALWNAPAVQLLIYGEGPEWTEKDVATFFTPFAFPKNDPSELGLGLLSAFSIAHQHKAEVVVHRSGPTGPGFEIHLPTDPQQVKHPDFQESLLQTVFT